MFSNYIRLYNKILNNDVIVYGFGQRGKKVYKALQRDGVNIIAIADRSEKEEKSNTTVMPPNVLYAIWGGGRNIICIVTPINIEAESIRKIRDNFEIVHDAGFIDWLIYFYPLDGNEAERAYKPFNRYDSPYPDTAQIQRYHHFCERQDFLGINLNEKEQLKLLCEIGDIGKIYANQIKMNENIRFQKNGMFPKGDAVVLYSIIKEKSPDKIIEIGSGFSSAVMLDACDTENRQIRLTCIDPDLSRCNRILKREDVINEIEDEVQNVSLDIFDTLDRGDILFIDSSHVAKWGSDVTYEIFQIIPRLKSGVIIHFHDIFWPMEYPEHWIHRGIYYNEIYLLRALLMYNDSFEILFFNDFLRQMHPAEYADAENSLGISLAGGSIYIKKNDARKYNNNA